MMHTAPDWLECLRATPESDLADAIEDQAKRRAGGGLLIRNRLVLPALKAGDPARAWTANSALLATDPENTLYWCDRATVAARRKDRAGTIAAARRLCQIAPQAAGLQARALQALMQAGATEHAADLARKQARNWPASARLAHLSMLALARVQAYAAAAQAASHALTHRPKDLQLAASAADILLHLGRARAAIAVLEDAGVTQGDDPRAWFELARARGRLGDLDGACKAAQAACARDPANARVLDLTARVMWQAGHRAEAEAIVQALPDQARTTATRYLEIDMLMARGATAQAALLAQDLASENLRDFPLMRRLTGVLLRAGEDMRARALYAQSLELRRAALPRTFAAGAAALLSGTDVPSGDPPQHRLDWLYAQLAARTAAPPDRTRWEGQMRRALALDRLALDWIEAHPDRLPEIATLIDADEASLAALKAAQANGQGVLLAAAHVGLLFPGLVALKATGLPMSFVASTPDTGQAGGGRDLLSTSSHDENWIMRQVMRALRAGRMVTVAIDGAAAGNRLSLPLFDQRIIVSDVVPRLAWKTGAPSFFPLAVPSADGRISSLLRPLPAPQDHDSADSFAAAWNAAFAQAITTALCTYPQAARASGGFWRGITL